MIISLLTYSKQNSYLKVKSKKELLLTIHFD